MYKKKKKDNRSMTKDKNKRAITIEKRRIEEERNHDKRQE